MRRLLPGKSELRAAVRLLAAALLFSVLLTTAGCVSAPPLRLITWADAPDPELLEAFGEAVRSGDGPERRLHALVADAQVVLLIVEVSARAAGTAGSDSDFVDALNRDKEHFASVFPPNRGGPAGLAWLFVRSIPAMAAGGGGTEVLLGTLSYWSDPAGRALWTQAGPATDAQWLSGYRDWVRVVDHSIIVPPDPGPSFLADLRGGRVPDLETAL